VDGKTKEANITNNYLRICNNYSKCTESIMQKFLINILQKKKRILAAKSKEAKHFIFT
jgi:hypothetical protein